MPRIARSFAATLLALGCSLQPTADSFAATAADAARHTLWSVKGKTNTVYLLGSVHFLSPTEQLPPAVDVAYHDAERLLMEIDMDDLDPLVMQQLTLERGVLPQDKTLESELGAAAYQKISTQARKLGLDPALLNRLSPWLAAMTLVQLQLMQMGLDPNSGVEQQLTTRAIKDGKEITGLETLQQQIGLLAGLPQQQQREFLMYSVEDTERASQEVETLIAAWRSGDTLSLARLLAEGFDKYPNLYRPLTVDRNRRWIVPIEALLDDRDDYLIVVGALHLVGKNSVIELLEGKGHKVTQH